MRFYSMYAYLKTSKNREPRPSPAASCKREVATKRHKKHKMQEKIFVPLVALSYDRISEYFGSAARHSASGTPSSFRTMFVPRTSDTVL